MSSEIEKSTVYVETTVIGHLAGRLRTDPLTSFRQSLTRLWWETSAERHRLLVSTVVLNECSAGIADAVAERQVFLQPLEILPESDEIQVLADELIRTGAVPETEPRDALHISIATVNAVEYLVTWNFKHIANPVLLNKIITVCLSCGYQTPAIVTPQYFMEDFDVQRPHQ